MTEPLRIIEGRTYKYVLPFPKGCTGQLYRVLRFAKDVQVHNDQIIMEGVTGPDKGQLFVCGLNFFSTRFRPMVDEVRGAVSPQPALSFREDSPTRAVREEYSMVGTGSGV